MSLPFSARPWVDDPEPPDYEDGPTCQACRNRLTMWDSSDVYCDACLDEREIDDAESWAEVDPE